jgi:hypothetical protein
MFSQDFILRLKNSSLEKQVPLAEASHQLDDPPFYLYNFYGMVSIVLQWKGT